MKQRNLFLAFLRVGLLGYGGGPASISLVHKEGVGKYKWMDDDEFADVLALGNTIPGPIATKMAGYIGYRVAGVLGMMNAVLATIVPTIVMMIILLTFLSSMKDQPWVQGMTRAVVPVVCVMLATLTWDFLKKSKDSLGWKVAAGIIIVSFVLMEFVGVHPGIIIGVLLVAAIAKKDKAAEVEQTTEKGVGM